MTTPGSVLEFWFGREPETEAELLAGAQRWSKTLDGQVRERFGEWIPRAIDGQLDHWLETHEGTLALVLMLDQFPRHVFRDDARQYGGDSRALELAQQAWRAGWPHELPTIRTIFLLLPLAHSENLSNHRLHLELARQTVQRTPAFYGQFAAIIESQAVKYHGIIERFGRFPHRNALLGRTSTPEEREWIEQGGPERMAPEFARKG